MPGKRNFSSYSQPQEQAESHTIMASRSNKKLRRLPHVFSKVLELPFKSDEDVFVEERHECFKFVANTNDGVVGGGGIHVVELHPGITKVVVRRRGSVSQLPSIDQLELDVWRFRLPTTACPELATVVYAGGQLVVTVPKNRRGGKNGEGVDCKPGFSDSMGRLITVQ